MRELEKTVYNQTFTVVPEQEATSKYLQADTNYHLELSEE